MTVTSGGVEVGSNADFATDYMRQVLNFIGVSEIGLVSASGLAVDQDKAFRMTQQNMVELDFSDYSSFPTQPHL